jgi:hypothetical protein
VRKLDTLSESRVPEIGTPGLMSGIWKRGTLVLPRQISTLLSAIKHPIVDRVQDLVWIDFLKPVLAVGPLLCRRAETVRTNRLSNHIEH